jgi:RimJ/RimL family protein N-acetyltransferase
MITHMTEWDSYYYAVFVKGAGEGEEELVGSVSLRRQLGGPVLPPPGEKEKEVDLRVLGYGFFEKAWGNGYATEAASALIEAYRECVMNEKARGEKRFYVEAGVDTANPASRAVLRKVGFKEVGWKVEKEGVFLGGVWRENGGYWVWGMDV